MGQVRFSGTVAVAIGQVFDYLTDPTNAPEVYRGMKELRQLSSGPLQRGSRLLAVRDAFEEEFTVTDYSPPSSYVLEGGIPRLTTSLGYQLQPTDAGTQLEMMFAWQLHGVWKLIAPLFHRLMNKEYQETFAHVVDRLGGRVDDQDQPSDLFA